MTHRISREEIHKLLYLFGMALLVCCLPLSRFMTSIAQFIIAINWLIEGDFKRKFPSLKQLPGVWLFSSLFFLYALGCIHSENLPLALERMKNALPLLLFPVVISTSARYTPERLKHLLLIFSAGVLAAAVTCIVIYFRKGSALNNFREISVFMPHIRFSLLIDMAIAVLLYFTLYASKPFTGLNKIVEKAVYLATAVFLCGFLLFLRSFTGIIILIAVIPVLVLNRTWIASRTAGYISGSLALLLWLGIAAAIWITWHRNFNAEPVQYSQLPSHTINGNPYQHDTSNCMLENGHFIGLYYCEPELSKEWNRISSTPFDGYDRQGQQISETIKRYLTSKGLRKDSAGIHSLTPEDRIKIESGIANYKFTSNAGLWQRLFETLWEIKMVQCTGYVNKHTLGQRLVFIEIAIALIKEKPWTGNGTGDVYTAMHERALSAGKLIDPGWEGKPHNQYLYFLLAFGFTGFLWILFCWIFPVMNSKAYYHVLFTLFAIIIVVSMITMDTMESYDSMAFFASFYCLFVFGTRSNAVNINY